MFKRFGLTLVVLVVFAVLFLYVNIYEVEPIPAAGEDNPVELAALKADAVKSLTWNTPGKEEVHAEVVKEGAATKFKLVKPREFRGEEGEFTGLLSRFESLKSQRTISANATDTKSFGIGTDTTRLTIENASGVAMTYFLGTVSPIGGSVYFTRSGDPALYLVPGDISSAFSKTVNDLRSRTIFPEDFTGISSVTVQLGTSTVELSKPQGGFWKIVSPNAVEADNGEVSGLIFGVHDLRMARFVEEVSAKGTASGSATAEADSAGDAKYGFDKPALRVQLRDGAKTYVFIVGREENGERFVKRADDRWVYAAPGQMVGQLEKDYNRLRTKDLPAVSRNSLTEIKVKLSSGSAEIRQQKAVVAAVENGSDAANVASKAASVPAVPVWVVGERKLDAGKINNLIDAWLSNKVQSFLPLSEGENEGLADEEKADRLEFLTAGGPIIISFGKGDGNFVTARIHGMNELVKVPVALHAAFKVLANEACPPPPAPPGGTPTQTSASAPVPAHIPVPALMQGKNSPIGIEVPGVPLNPGASSAPVVIHPK
ncbi:MAG: DUF4340 domain-containing protein [Candidatus Ozemobacteraceae bacterium]